jgi:CheY-like chemotaxis protein
VGAREEGRRVDDKAFLAAVSRALERSRLRIAISGWSARAQTRRPGSPSIVPCVLLGLVIADLFSKLNPMYWHCGAIVDDELSVCTAYARIVRSAKMQPRTFESVEEFMHADLSDENACVISDVRMPETSDLELPGLLARAGRHLPVIFITAHDTPEMRDMARRAGAAAYFHKPVDDRRSSTRSRGLPASGRTTSIHEFQCSMNRQKFHWNYSRVFRP